MSLPQTEGEKHEEGKRSTNRDARRRSLVLAAYQLIAEKGFEQLRTRDVAARAGVNISTLHYYFTSKEDLIPAVVDHLLDEFSANPVPGTQLDDATPLGQIRAMFSRTYDRFEARPEMFIVLSELVLRSLRSPLLQTSMQRLDQSWHGYLTFMINNGITEGSFRADLDSDEMATRLIIMFKGFFFHQITSPGAIEFHTLFNDIERLLLA